MREPLTPEYLENCRLRANRYMGQWTGTAGSLAADVRRLLWEVERLKGDLLIAKGQKADVPYWLRPHD